MKINKLIWVFIAAQLLFACGGGGSDDEPDQFAIGGVVYNFNGTINLGLKTNGDQNYRETVEISSSGTDVNWRFIEEHDEGTPFDVSVYVQPQGQVCSVENGNGVLNPSNANNIKVSCVDTNEDLEIGIKINNLKADITLQLSIDNVVIETSTLAHMTVEQSTFYFNAKQVRGVYFSIDIIIQPDGQQCTVMFGSGELSTGNVSSAQLECTNNPTEPAVLTGTLVDSPVTNISFSTPTQQGVTNINGEFTYSENENVTFAIGEIVFPSVSAKDIVTPLDIAATNDFNAPSLINMLRLLQTLDIDADPTNGINISDAALANATVVDFNLPVIEFAAQPAISNLLANAGLESLVSDLVSAEQAQTHFLVTLIELGIIEQPPTACNEDVSYSLTGKDLIMGTNEPLSTSPLSGILTISNTGACQLSANEGYESACTITDGVFSAFNGRLTGTIANSEVTILNQSTFSDDEYVSAYLSGNSTASCIDEPVVDGTYSFSGLESVSQNSVTNGASPANQVYPVTGTVTISGSSCSVTSSEGDWNCIVNGNSFHGVGDLSVIQGTITYFSVSFYLPPTSDGEETVFGQYSGKRN